ncbi:mediator of RNA polymerase II transcription subunit 11-like [Oppia nitens]|uniref:mediator of RNA polymerase II transcription subunit 11-like n=1 Tax=Oppia nitens TaxID=1686743 RepID=UPI0023D9A727|nr:mediator of RNA polymerase II transcription subunit 11-like [Oppia nitens]
MAGYHQNERLKKLDVIEQQLCQSIQSASAALAELGKDKPSIKQVETQSTQFLKALESIDNDISKQIQYLTRVSTGQAHEGSSYASMKVNHMAWHRLEHSRTRLNDLDRLRVQHQLQHQHHQQQQQQPPPQQQPQQ